MGAEDKSEKAYDKKADNYNNTFDGSFITHKSNLLPLKLFNIIGRQKPI